MDIEFKPNKETIEALEEARRICENPSAYKSYTDVHQMFEDILSEPDEEED